MNTFTTMISEDIKYYNISFYVNKKVKVDIYDSLKIINLTVEQIAKSFGMPFQKKKLIITNIEAKTI